MSRLLTADMKNQMKSAANVVSSLITSDELTWEELKAIEKRRRAILKRTELPFYRILAFWDGTCLRILAFDPLFWLSIALYIGVRFQARYGVPEAISSLDSNDIAVIGGFLSFFLVFFVVQSNNRFNTLYGYSMSCEGRIFDVASVSRSSLPRENGLRLVRYMNAAHLAAYVGLSDTYSSQNFFMEINKTTRMLSGAELERMAEIDLDKGGSAYRELIAWALNEVQRAADEELIDGRLASLMREKILALRGSIGALYDYDDQPVSFFYVHFLILLSSLYLPLFAVSAAFNAGTGDDAYWATDILSGLIVMLQVIFVIGLRLLGQKMANPYGDDLEDLSVMHYVNFTYLMSSRILAARFPAPIDADFEETLCRERASIGAAFEPDSRAPPEIEGVVGADSEKEDNSSDRQPSPGQASFLSGYFFQKKDPHEVSTN